METVYLKIIKLMAIYTKRPMISDGSVSEMLAAGGSNMKESASAPVVETLPVVGYYDSSQSDTLVVNEDGSTEQLSIPAIELASPKDLKIRKFSLLL